MAQWRVVVADDNEDVSNVVDAVLRRDGRFTIYHARNGEDALALTRLYSPHVLVLDIMMPRIHGLKVCKTLKGDPSTAAVKIVMLSALGREYTKREALQFGADAFLTKPFSPRDLVSSIEQVLRGEQVNQGTAAENMLRGEVFVFNRGDEVRVSTPDGDELKGIVKGRIPPGQGDQNEWSYRIGLETGSEIVVQWDEVMPARVLEHAS